MVVDCGSSWHRPESSLCGWLMEGGASVCFLPGELETASQAPCSLSLFNASSGDGEGLSGIPRSYLESIYISRNPLGLVLFYLE